MWCDTEARRYADLCAQARAQGMFAAPNGILVNAAHSHGERTALIVGADAPLTYRELAQQANGISRWARKRGIGPGSRVMIYVENSAFFYAAYYGLWQTGATLVPLNTFLQAEEVAHIAHEVEPPLVIISDTFKQLFATVALPYPTFTEAQLRTEAPPADTFTPVPLTEAEPALILYTSGTTGRPKGVMLSASAIVHNMMQSLARLSLRVDERVLCPLPLFHSFAQNTCAWSALHVGATVILIPKITRTSLRVAAAQQPTIVLGIPALYGLLCRFPELSFSHTRFFVSGGDALPINIRRFFAMRYGRKLCNGYGLTETSPVIALDLDDVISPTHTIGYPLPDIECKLVDSQDGIGTLWVRGPNLMSGYYRHSEATAAVIVDGWFNTGDLARYDETGKLIICGREKDLIINKGIKIYPQEIETVLTAHPNILMAAVVGVLQHGTERPVAHVQLHEGVSLDSSAMHAWCSARLAAYKVPQTFVVHDKLPMTPTGKIDKKQLIVTD